MLLAFVASVEQEAAALLRFEQAICVPKCADVSSTSAIDPAEPEERNTPTIRAVIGMLLLEVCPESLQSIAVTVPMIARSPAVAPPVSVTQFTVPTRATSTVPPAETEDMAMP
jgi:hypothetical protein